MKRKQVSWKNDKPSRQIGHSTDTSMPEHKNNLGCQTEHVKSCIIRHIRESNLSVGDKLPSQAELRENLKVGSETIRRAVFALRDIGVVELRGNHGVFLRSMDADGSFGCKIGVVCRRERDTPYEALFCRSLAYKLHDRGYQEVLFLRKDGVPAAERDALGSYSGLRRNIIHKEINGLILTVPLDEPALALCRENEVPYVYCGSAKGIKWSIYFASTFIEEGIRHLQSIGCVRAALVDPGFSPVELPDWKGLQFRSDGNYPRDIAAAIAELPESERPDGLMIPDEGAALSLATVLLLRGIALPKLIVCRIAQFPADLPFEPAGVFSFDYLELAGHTAELLFRQFKKTAVMPESIRCEPLFFGEGEIDHTRRSGQP
jgi:hypothetical protein